ncbi:MAG: hypothetical protein ABI480_02810 [Chitinophagaceae bacterium]
MPTDIARSMVVCTNEDANELSAYQAQVVNLGGNNKMRLVKDGQVYNGNAPYLIVNIDGAEKTSLESFSPTLASNSILKSFYGGSDKTEEVSKVLLDAVTLYNDLAYKNKADKQKTKLDNIKDKTGDDFKSAEALYNAYLANIQNNVFK